MAEDPIMEFEEASAGIVAPMAALHQSKREIEDALVPIMTGLVQMTGLMRN